MEHSDSIEESSPTADLSSSEAFAAELIGRMTLAEKAAQMTQADKGAISPAEVAEHGIGSILSGGGGNPEPNHPGSWLEMVQAFVDAALRSRLGIPLIYGTDAVHGHSNVVGATIFPHNIGLGAARDQALIEQVYRATALETAATGSRWNFAPTLAVSLDPRWGRCYEAFGDDPEMVSDLGSAAVRGLQGDGFPDPGRVLSCLKHFVGDGGAVWGTASRAEWTDWWNEWGTHWHIDQGDTRCDEPTMRSTHLLPYGAALAAGALSVMASYSSWNGDKMHGHREMLTGVLKGEMGFRGFVVSDWMGIDQLHPDHYECVVRAVGAGVDMVMVPFEWRRFIDDVVTSVEAGDLSEERVDDAVRRIVTVKHAMGLFGEQLAPPPIDVVGCDRHRLLARRAAAASAVLLKDEGGLLPLGDGPVLVAGRAADDIGLQCGGWTISWQGGEGPITPGSTILDGLRARLGDGVSFRADAGFDAGVTAPLGVAVIAERPYAEGLGDRGDLALAADDVELVERLSRSVESLVLVIISGRPLLLDAVADRCDAIVAAWLPGSEGAGVADVLTGDRPFRGRLPRPWPAGDARVAGAAGPAWDRGHGLIS
jgi:beta-glucosidase